MIIACPSCSAKYQLADSKIKASGTKVRCPRCSHTFSVYREQEEDDFQSEKTELFIRRDEVFQQKPAAKSSMPKATPPAAEQEENIFDQKTSVSSAIPPTPKPKAPKVSAPQKPASPPPPAAEETAPPKRVEKKPKEDPARIVTPENIDDEIAEAAFGDADDSVASKEIKPFGEATLFEIQRGFGKKKNPKRLLQVGGLAVSAAAVLLLALKIFDSSDTEVAGTKQEAVADLGVEILRPSGWYKDEPRVYQETLGQIAALPPAEQDKPENRALLAEALILGGLLSGAADQVISGMGFSSSLVVSHALSPFGYYGIAAYALWNEDRRTLQDLVDRWPEAFRDDPEFALVEFGNDILSKNYVPGFQKLKSILKSSMEFQRANDFGLLFALRHPEAAAQVFSTAELKQMQESYQRHRSLLQRELSNLPKLPQLIDALLESETPKQVATEDKPQTTQRTQKSAKAEVPIPPEKSFPDDDRPSAKAAKSGNPQKGSRLPAPSANLLAQNKVSERQKSEAAKLFESGNNLYKQGKADDALKAYRDALKLNPEYADIYKRIGMIYMSRQESDRALRSFRIYLQLKPDSDDKQLVEGWISSLQ